MDSGIIFYFFLFLFVVFLAFYVPGNIFVDQLKLTKLQKTTLSISFGIVLWALQGFLFAYLHIREITYLYLFICALIWLKLNRSKLKFKKITFYLPTLQNLLFGTFITLAVLTQLITTFANGITTPKGIYFCCALPDSLFHIALTNELITQFPPHEPGISNVLLKNYHFLPNLINADLIRVFHIPLLYLQYPFTSILITLLLAFNVLTFAQLTIKKLIYSYWLLFFVFFSGDILFLLTLITHGSINFHSEFLENASWLWISPPRVYGAMLLFAGLNFIFLWIHSKKGILLDILVSLTIGCLIGIKVYFAVFALVGLAGLFLIYLKEKNKRKILVIIFTFLVSIGLYLPINSGAGGLIFTGFWRFNDFASNSVFGLQKMELARYVYIAHGNWFHALLYTLSYFITYFIFIFGTLLLSLFQTKNSLSLLDKKIHIFLISGLVACFIFGSFFIQKTGIANSSQFLITDMIMLSIYTALILFSFTRILKKSKMTIVLISLIIVIFTVPRVIYECTVTLLRIEALQGLIIDHNQLAALKYLRNYTPENAIIMQDNTYGCSYLSFLGQRQSYICLDGAPEDRGVATNKRIQLQKNIFTYNKRSLASLHNDHIVQYLYMPSDTYFANKKVYQKYGYNKKYSNKEITIVQVY